MLDLLAAISWDPQVRGALIVMTAVVLLCGSVYLILATNTGIRTGFLLAAAAVFGWLCMLFAIWSVYGLAQGPRGSSPEWDLTEIVEGPISLSTTPGVEDFPEGWEELSSDQRAYADAAAAGTAFLIPPVPAAGGHGETKVEEREFDPPFESTEEFVIVQVWDKGGNDWPMIGNVDLFAVFHEPHYSIVVAAPVLEEPGGITSVPQTPQPDPDAPLYQVVMTRNLGTVRLPTAVFSLLTGAIFVLIVFHLHRRERLVISESTDLVKTS